MQELLLVAGFGFVTILVLRQMRPETEKEKKSNTQKLDRLWAVAQKSMRDRKFVPAEKALLTILKLDHKNAAAYNRLGILYARQRNFEDAIECFEITSSLEPKPSSLHNLGLIYYETGKLEKSASSFQRALDLEPMAARFIALAKVRHKQDKSKQMVESLESAAELEPNPQTYKLLMEAYKSTGQDELAAEKNEELQKLIVPKGGSKRVKRAKKAN